MPPLPNPLLLRRRGRRRALRDILRVSPKCQEKEERAEDVFALSNPGDGLDMEWMQGEKGCEQSATPQSTGHSSKQQKKQDRISDMKACAYQMLRSGIRAEKLAIEHV